MRILIIDVNFEYKNPMYKQFYISLLSCMEVDFFGPGYVSRESLERGIGSFIKDNGIYDAILMGTYFVYSIGPKGTKHNAYKVHRRTLPYYNVNDAYQCCGKIYEELLAVKNIIKIFVYYEDTWCMPRGIQKMCHRLLEGGFYILGWPLECMEKAAAKQMKEQDGWTNCLYELAYECGDRYLPVSFHGIGYHEIFVRNFSDRSYEWSVPGNKAECFYPERSKAQKEIEKTEKRVWSDDPFQLLSVETIQRKHMEWYKFRHKSEKILSWIWGKNESIASQPQMRYIATCREQYLESMRSSKFVYAESGFINVFVRKYFETCACGAVLVAKKVPGMEEMGFIHEENCIIVNKYEDIVNIDEMYTEGRLEQIAKAGQKLILGKHMFVHRADALKRTIEVIQQGNYKGAYWKDGNYLLKK